MKPMSLSIAVSIALHGLIFSIPTASSLTRIAEEIPRYEKRVIHLVSSVSRERDVPLPPPSPYQKERSMRRQSVRPPQSNLEPRENYEPRVAQVDPVESVTETQKVEGAAEVIGPGSEPEVTEMSQETSSSLDPEETHGFRAIGGMRDAYLARLRARIEAVRRYPDRARRMGHEGKVVVRFMVRAGGQVEGVSVAEAHSSPILNQAAMETVRSLGLLPPLPPELGEQMEVALPLVYRLEQTAMR